MRAPPPARALAWAEAAVGSRSRLDGWAPLPGGSACAVHAVDVLDAGGVRHPLVLKRFVQADWLAREPDLAEREARHLRLLEGADLPVPGLVGVDARGEACDGPALLMTRLPGRSLLRPRHLGAWLRALAGAAAVLHRLPESLWGELPAYRSYGDPLRLDVPAWTRRPDVWERALERLAAPAPAAPQVFLHRDYHPANVLFHRGRLSGVLDWTACCRGPAATDLGHCRINLAQLHGPEVADDFERTWRALAPELPEPDPYWDLLCLASILPGPEGLYPGWQQLGAGDLDAAQCRARLDAFAAGVVARL